MNRKLQELAYRNVKKYKKHYLFVFILIFCISVFFLVSTMTFNNHYEAEKLYNQQKYGTWYYSTMLKAIDIPLLEKRLEGYNKQMKYCYLYEQGEINGSSIVHASNDNIYELYSLDLIEGRELENKDEILITNVYQKENNIKINDILELTVNGVIGEYKVVGILNVKNELYPSIYTDIKESQEVIFLSNHELYGINHSDSDEYIELRNSMLNQFGYSVSALAQMDLTYEQLILLGEVLILTIFALIALNSTYLKRRNKEFALLRGIGMTNKQLFVMIMYEMTYTSLISTILAFISSFLVTFIVSKILEMIYGFFVYKIYMSQMIFYSLFLLSAILLALVYPIYSSSNNSLSGTFDSQKFQYIQIKYTTLKYQNKFRLALREIGSHKKFTLLLLVIFIFLSISYMTSLVDVKKLKPWDENKYRFDEFQYYEHDCYSKEELENFQSVFSDYQLVVYEYNNEVRVIDNIDTFVHNGFIKLNADVILKNSIIEGKIPEKDNEVLLGKYYIVLDEFTVEYDDYGNSFASQIEYKRLSINDTFIIDNIEYKVVGIIKPNESRKGESYIDPFNLYYAPEGIYVIDNAFNKLTDNKNIKYNCRIYYDEKDSVEIQNKYIQYGFGNYMMSSNWELESERNIPHSLLDIDPKLLILPMLVGFIFIYYLNKNHIMNNSSDIALFKLIGMTNKDLMRKQLCQAFILSGIVIGIELFWIFILNSYYNLIFIPVLEFLFSVIVILIITVIIYCLPLRSILKNNIFDLIKGDE